MNTLFLRRQSISTHIIHLKKVISEKNITLVFDVSLLLKGLFALSEILSGVFIYVFSFIGSIFINFGVQKLLFNVTRMIVQGELTEDPKDVVANYLLHVVQNLSVGSLHFISLYLISHGVIKLLLIVGLFRKKLSYYPISMIVFGLLVVYQLYRLSFAYSVWLLLITVLDIMIIWLTWHEYQYLSHR